MRVATRSLTSPSAFNWTSGYRRDATLPDEYEHFVTRAALKRLLATQELAPLWFSGVTAAREMNRIRDVLKLNPVRDAGGASTSPLHDISTYYFEFSLLILVLYCTMQDHHITLELVSI